MRDGPTLAERAAAVRAAEIAAKIAFPDAPPGKRDPSIGLRRSGFRVGYLAALATLETKPAAQGEQLCDGGILDGTNRTTDGTIGQP